MKKGLAIVLVIGMMLSLCACSGTAERKDSKEVSLYEKGLEVVALMEEMVRNEEYVNLYTANTEISEVLRELGKGNYTEVQAVYQIKIPSDDLISIVTQFYGEAPMGKMSEELTRVVEQKMVGALVSQIIGMGGATNLAAATVCTANQMFLKEGLTEDVIYIYVYKDTVPAAVTFVRGEDGIVSATGNFLLNDSFGGGSEQVMKEFFEEIGLEISTVEME